MKKLFLLMALVALTFTVVSCSSMLPARFERFVDKVEQKAPTYTEEDWNKVSDRFQKLVASYKKSYDKLTKEERKSIESSIGRYRAIVFKSGVKNAIQSVNDTLSDLYSTLRNVIEGVGSFIKELGNGDSSEE